MCCIMPVIHLLPIRLIDLILSYDYGISFTCHMLPSYYTESFWGEWPSGLMHCTENLKDPGSTPLCAPGVILG